MAPVTSSFIADIVQSLITHLTTEVGTGSLVYPTPAWLQVKAIDRAGGMPQPNPPEHNMPAIWIEYLAGMDQEGGLGQRHFGMVEGFNVYSIIRLDPEIMEMSSLDDTSATMRYAEAAADTLMRRIWKAITEWSDSITDSLIGGTTNGARVITWAVVHTNISDRLFETRTMMSIEVDVE